MANEKDKSKSKSKDFYQVLVLNKKCSATEVRNAYKKLALRWHPDRCSASGSSKFAEEAKQNFQAIQQAYSVLSDDNKTFLYDVGAYDSDDDEYGMGEFLNEMAVMMSQTKPNENGDETFGELQELFEEIFQDDVESFSGSYEATNAANGTSSSYSSYSGSSSSSVECSNSTEESPGFSCHFPKFQLGVEKQSFKKREGARKGKQGINGGNREKNGRKQKVSSGLQESSS